MKLGRAAPRAIRSQAAAPRSHPMDFRLTSEQTQIATMVREFAESEIKPHLMEWDEAQHFPVERFRKAGELGMLGVTIPEEYGGAGLSYVDYVNVIEELGVVDSGFALSVAAHNSFCTGHIYIGGEEERKKKGRPEVATGGRRAARGPTPPRPGSDTPRRADNGREEGVWWGV